MDAGICSLLKRQTYRGVCSWKYNGVLFCLQATDSFFLSMHFTSKWYHARGLEWGNRLNIQPYGSGVRKRTEEKMTKQALKMCEKDGISSACANHVHSVMSHISAAIGQLCRCYAGAVFKRFVNDNNRYLECFQALKFDNLVQSKFHLCNNENEVSF